MPTADLGTLRAAIVADDKEWTKGFKDAEKTLTVFGKKVPKLVKPISKALLGLGVGTTAALGLAVGKFATFEKSMKNVAAVSGAIGDEFEKLSAFALEMGSTTAFTAKEAADGMYFLASAGLSVAEQMQATSAVLDLAAATQSELALSSQAVVNTLSGFSLQADQARRVADVFAESISSSQATLSKLSTSLPITSSAFSDMKWSVEENVAALSLLFDKGGRAETAATGLRMAIKTLLAPTKEATIALNSMGLTVGDVSPLTNTLAEIVGKLEDANFDTTKSIKIFGKENDAMSKLVSQGSEKLREFEQALIDSAGAAEKMRDIQLDTLSCDLTLFKCAAEGAAIALGSTLAPAVRAVTDGMTAAIGKFNELPKSKKDMVGFGIAGAAAFASIAGAAGLVVTKIPAMVEGFKMLPAITGPVALVTAGVLLNAAAWAEAYKHYKMWRDGIITAEDDAEGWEKATKKQREAFDLLTLSMQQAKDHGYDPLAMNVSELNVDFPKLNELLGSHTKLTMNAGTLHDILAKNLGETKKKLGTFTEAAEEANEALAEVAEVITEEAAPAIAAASVGFLDFGNAAKVGMNTGSEFIIQGAEDNVRTIGTMFDDFDKKELIYRTNSLAAITARNLERIHAATGLNTTLSGFADAFHTERIEKIDTNNTTILTFAEQFKTDMIIKTEDMNSSILQSDEQSTEDRAAEIAKLREAAETTALAKVDAIEKVTAAEATRLSKFESFLSQEIGSVRMQKELVGREYDEMKDLYLQYGEDLISLDSWRAGEMLKIEKSLTDNKIEELNRYSSRFEERLANDTKLAADYWGAVDLVTGTFDEQKYLESRKGAGGYIYQGMDPGYLKRLNAPMDLVSLSTKKTTAALKDMEKQEGDLKKASAILSDELAGHSLTTAFYSVQESMRGFATGMVENIDSIIGFSDLAEAAGRDVVQAESEKTAKVEQIFGNFLSGKIEKESQAYSLMLAAELEYQEKAEGIRDQYNEKMLEKEAQQARALRLITAMEYRGVFDPQESFDLRSGSMGYEPPASLGQSTPTPSAQAAQAAHQPSYPQYAQEPTRVAPTIQIYIDNMYGGDEGALNNFAEDIARRIQAQNITI